MKHQPERSKKSAGSQPEDRTPITHPDDPRNTTWHGYWNLDGSRVATGDAGSYLGARPGSLTHLLRRLVHDRRENALAPRAAAILVESHRFQDAFPNFEWWMDAPTVGVLGPLTLVEQWIQCPSNTSAEQAVKSAGMGFLLKHDDDGPQVAPGQVEAFMARWRKHFGITSEEAPPPAVRAGQP